MNINELGPKKKRELPKELAEVYGFFTLTNLENGLNESSLYHEYEGDAIRFLNNLPDTNQKKLLLEKLKSVPREEFLKEDELEGFYNFCTSLKNLLEAELKGSK